MSGPQRKHNYASHTVKEALSKLLTTLETIELRKGLKPHEKKRAQCALFLTQQPPQPEETKADERRENYRRFLKKVNENCGPEPVIVSAIGLGQTAIGGMVEFHRLRLPSEIKKHEKCFKSALLQVLVQEAQGNEANPEALQRNNVAGNQEKEVQLRTAEKSSSFEKDMSLEPQQSSLSGRVFALTHEDARAVVMSNQIAGEVWMTDPYDNASLSFITIPISDEIALHFSAQRRQVM